MKLFHAPSCHIKNSSVNSLSEANTGKSFPILDVDLVLQNASRRADIPDRLQLVQCAIYLELLITDLQGMSVLSPTYAGSADTEFALAFPIAAAVYTRIIGISTEERCSSGLIGLP